MNALQPILAVALVLGLLAALLAVLRGRGIAGPASGRRMQVLERMPLGPHHALHLVRVGGRSLLVATTPSACQILETLEKDTEA